MSIDPVESEPLYQYVRGNPVNRVDPSGKFPAFPPPPPHEWPSPVQPEEDPCVEWSTHGGWQSLCYRAYNGDRDAMEEIYRYIANIEDLTHLQKASEALHHFLNGTSTPGDPLYFSWSWYFSASETKNAYLNVREQVYEEVKGLEGSCACNTPPENPIKRTSDAINIDPSYGIPHEIQVTLGAHNLNVEADLNLNSECVGVITFEWYVYEYFDFRKWPGNVFEIPFLGWDVPAAWVDFLVDDARAAEYWLAVQHREQKPYSPK